MSKCHESRCNPIQIWHSLSCGASFQFGWHVRWPCLELVPSIMCMCCWRTQTSTAIAMPLTEHSPLAAKRKNIVWRGVLPPSGTNHQRSASCYCGTSGPCWFRSRTPNRSRRSLDAGSPRPARPSPPDTMEAMSDFAGRDKVTSSSYPDSGPFDVAPLKESERGIQSYRAAEHPCS